MIVSLHSQRLTRIPPAVSGHVGPLAFNEERSSCIEDLEALLAYDQELSDCLSGLEGTLELVEAARQRSAASSTATTPLVLSAFATPVLGSVMRPSLNPLEDVFSHLSNQLASVQSNHARLLGGKTVSEVMREIDVLRGHKRALDFGLPLLDHELTTLTSRLESSRSELPKLQRELSSLQSERSSLLKTVDDMKTQLRSLNDRLSTTYPTSDELSALEDRNQSLQKQVADLQHSADQLKSELTDIKGAGGVEQAKWDLVSRKKKLVSALQSLASSQQSVSEWWMAQLSFAIDREEKIQKLRSLERELFLIRGDESQLFSIPEHVPVRTLDFEGEDIQARQEDLANLEKALKEADWVHRGLLLRISELERDLS